jgi:molecular chaperone DnaK (HSP70)
MHAAELVEKKGRTLLLDVVGSSLGVGIAGGLVKPLIRKNTMLPCKTKEVFYPGRDHQSQVRVPVVQGESRLVSENVVLGELLLGDLGGSNRSEVRIEVTFALNQEGILSVSAVDQRSGKSKTVEVNARPTLSPPELERRAQSERANRTEVASIDSEERERNRHARRTLHNVVTELQGMHDQVLRAAAVSNDPESKDIAERLGRKLVEAQEVENSGSVSQVLAMAQSMVELLGLVVAPVPPAFETMPGPLAPSEVAEPAPVVVSVPAFAVAGEASVGVPAGEGTSEKPLGTS